MKLAIAMSLVDRQARMLDVLHHDNVRLQAQVEVLQVTLSGYVPAIKRRPDLVRPTTQFKPGGAPEKIWHLLKRGQWLTHEQIADGVNRNHSTVTDAMVQLRRNGIAIEAREAKDVDGRRRREFRIVESLG